VLSPWIPTEGLHHWHELSIRADNSGIIPEEETAAFLLHLCSAIDKVFDQL